MNIVKGSVVKSLAGRDRDRYFVAVLVTDRLVYLADGKERKLEKPKAKNPRHISPTCYVLDTEDMTNKKLKKLLSELKTQGSPEADCLSGRETFEKRD